MKKQAFFYVEITDTFCGEANYSWVTRHKVKASTARGAMRKIGSETGLSWHKVQEYYDMQRWDSRSGATCAFISEWDDEQHGQYRYNEI